MRLIMITIIISNFNDLSLVIVIVTVMVVMMLMMMMTTFSGPFKAFSLVGLPD